MCKEQLDWILYKGREHKQGCPLVKSNYAAVKQPSRNGLVWWIDTDALPSASQRLAMPRSTDRPCTEELVFCQLQCMWGSFSIPERCICNSKRPELSLCKTQLASPDFLQQPSPLNFSMSSEIWRPLNTFLLSSRSQRNSGVSLYLLHICQCFVLRITSLVQISLSWRKANGDLRET